MLLTGLQRALGASPGPTTSEMVRRAVAEGVTETDDLDWKGELPPAEDLPQTDFPKDVAAMANADGGIIVFGVNEAEKAATQRLDVGGLSEAHERALRSPVRLGVDDVDARWRSLRGCRCSPSFRMRRSCKARESATTTTRCSLVTNRKFVWPASIAEVTAVTDQPPEGETSRASRPESDQFPVPSKDVERLVELHRLARATPRDAQAAAGLDLLSAQLVRRGYKLQAIANVLGVSRQAIDQRVRRIPASALEGVEDEVAAAKARVAADAQKARAQQARMLRLSDEEVIRIKEIRPAAQKYRAGTRFDAPAAVANREYLSILLRARERGVTTYTMGKQLGLTTGGVALKLARVNGTLPPSMRPGAKKADDRPAGPDPQVLLDAISDDIAHLIDLLRAAEIRPGRGPMHPGRLEASRRFDETLAILVTAHPIPLAAVAELLGRSRSSLAMRLTAYLGSDAASAITAGDPVSPDSGAPHARLTGDIPHDPTEDDVSDGEDLDSVANATTAAGGSVARPGWLTDFTPETTPAPAANAPAPAVVDQAGRHAGTRAHMDLTRQLRQSARAGGHRTQAWDVGQDVCFVHGASLVNVEVKSIGGGIEQYLLGVGQLLEQVEHHLAHIEAHHPWYAATGVTGVVGVLVVSDSQVEEVWLRLATRHRITIWSAEQALRVFADPSGMQLPLPATP